MRSGISFRASIFIYGYYSLTDGSLNALLTLFSSQNSSATLNIAILDSFF